MIADLKPYAANKESALAWLGTVPEHWAVVPHRALFEEVKDRNHPDEEMLSVTITGGIVRQKALLDGTSKKDASNQDKTAYKLVQPRDIAYNKMRAWQGAIGASKLRGIVSPAYVVMRLRNDDLLPEYFHHLFRTPQFAKEVERWSYGITSDMWSLRPEHFKMIYSPEPPPDEQAAIVRFLDWANGRLERAIRAKRKVIALLYEQKQAIIHRAVTRGLDPNVPLKPSGILWLGDIPAHWEVRRLRASVSDCVNGIWGGEPDGVDDLTCVRVADFDRKSLRVNPGRRTTRSIPQSARARRVLSRGDLLLEKSGGGEKQPVGAVVIYNSDEPAVCSNFVARMPVAGGYNPEFVNYLHSALYARRVNVPSIKQTTGIQNLDGKAYLAERVAFPPIEEQRSIAVFLDKEAVRFDTAISRLTRETDLLREYRTRLTADVVTGKLDVREVAARLPEEAPLEAAEEDADMTGESDLAEEMAEE